MKLFDGQIASLITELSRLRDVLESDYKAHNLDQIRSNAAELMAISANLHGLLSTATTSLGNTHGPMWLIETSDSQLSEAVAAPEPDWDHLGAILSFLESGINQLIETL